MNTKEFYTLNHKSIIDKLIDCQLLNTTSYTHENNIQIGLRYEQAIAELENWEHRNQQAGAIKHDLAYLEELIEFKSGKYDLMGNYIKGGRSGTPKQERVPYKKAKGDSEYVIEDTFPNYLMVYQKYDISNNYPAVIGLISHDRLCAMVADQRFEKTKADLYMRIDRGDFDCGYYVENKIPKTKPGYEAKILEIEKLFEEQRVQAVKKCLMEYKTGDFVEIAT